MFDLVAMGEILIDFTPRGMSEQGNPMFEQNPGGGPANLACAAAKHGSKVSFITKAGKDNFGRFLKKVIEENGVDASNFILSEENKTTLAFVHLDATGDRSFSFYRKNGADTMIKKEEVNLDLLKNTRYFFLSSVLMAEGTSRDTSFYMMEQAKSLGIPIIFDPNLRFNLWEKEEELKECVQKSFRYADIVKVSEEELFYFTEHKTVKEAAAELAKEYEIAVLMVTLGGEGCYLLYQDEGTMIKGYKVDKVVDTTAAGDSFTGGFVSRLTSYEKPYYELNQQELIDAISYGNGVGALTVTKKGAISALPTKEEVEKFRKGLD